MLKRHARWPEALAAEITRAWSKPFSWGSNDCCLFACDCVLAMTDVDIAASFRGYRSRVEAREFLKKNGGVGGIAEAVAVHYEIPLIAPLCAGRGDIFLLDAGHGETLGVCTGDRIVCPGFQGLLSFPILQGIRAWRIG
jgi:hypothetical protein